MTIYKLDNLEQEQLQLLFVVVEEGMVFQLNQVKEMQELLEDNTLSYGVFECDNVVATYEEFRLKGVNFCIEPYLN